MQEKLEIDSNLILGTMVNFDYKPPTTFEKFMSKVKRPYRIAKDFIEYIMDYKGY